MKQDLQDLKEYQALRLEQEQLEIQDLQDLQDLREYQALRLEQEQQDLQEH